jgi:hypothetical protein
LPTCSWQALEYQVQQGGAEAVRDDLFLVPLLPEHQYLPPIHATAGVLRLLQPAMM